MKGIVFTEFIEYVETALGVDVIEAVLEQADLASGGIYTAVGTYDHNELLTLIGLVSKRTDTEPKTLILEFGDFLFQDLVKLYPQFIEASPSLMDFLSSLQQWN